MSNDPLARLAELGLRVPDAPEAVGAYEPWQRMGNIVTTSFQLPWVDGKLAFVGRLGAPWADVPRSNAAALS